MIDPDSKWVNYLIIVSRQIFTGCFTAKGRPFVSRRLDFCSEDKNWISVCSTDCTSERQRHDPAPEN